jgi:biopolymer transport protein ExbB
MLAAEEVTVQALTPRNQTRAQVVVAVLVGLLASGEWPARVAAQDAAADGDTPSLQIAATQPQDEAAAAARAEAAGRAGGAAAEPGTAARLRSVWDGSDLVARGSLICLVVMLVGGAYVLLRRGWDQHLVLRSAKTVRASFWTAPNLYEAVRNLEPDSPFRAIAEDGLEAATHRENRLTDRIDANEWIVLSLQRSVAAIAARLQQGIVFLAAVRATAPFVGLFGTVWGVHRALTDGGAGLAVEPIGAALLMTAAGLAVAALAAFAIAMLAARNATASAAVRDFAADVQALLLSADSLVDPARTRAPGALRTAGHGNA